MQLPVHIASSTGNKNLLKRLIDSVSSQTLEAKDDSGNTPLMLSVLCNSYDCANLLLKAGVHVDNADSLGQTALHIAMVKGFHRCIKLLLSYNASYEQRNFSGVTPLHIAAVNPNSKCLSVLLKTLKHGEADVQDISNKTALHWCSAYAMVDHIKMLLLKGANICIPDNQGKTPLHWAALNPDTEALECIKILTENGGDLINWQDYEGRSALHLAVATGNIEVVRYLVAKETCNTDILDNAFCTPLHWAASKGLHEKADILLKRSSHTNADDNGATPMHYASYHNQVKTVEIFLSRAYIEDVCDKRGRSAVMWAAAKNSNDVIEIIAQNNTNLELADKIGLTALHIAAINGNVSTINVLMKYNLHFDIKDIKGLTPLLRACQFGRAKAALSLVTLGANINAVDVDNRSALHWCAIGGHAYLCQTLLQMGIYKYTQDYYGRTPLHYACIKKSLNCVSVLLESDYNPNTVDKEGKSSLHWAILVNHSEIVKLLCDYEADVNILFLNHSWTSPLDLANQKNNFKIVNCLKMKQALTVEEIKIIAAKKILTWYRKKKLFKHIFCAKRNSPMKCLKNCDARDYSFEQAASIIQRAWRKYFMKKKFFTMQSTIQKTYGTIEKRINAEKQWCLKLQSFLDNF